MNEREPCPLCGNAATKQLRKYEVEVVCREWKRYLQIEVASEFSGISEFELVHCTSCDFQFFKPDCIAGSAALYQKLEEFDWYYLPRKWEHDVALVDLNGCENGIEVGAGRGDFVIRVRKETGIQFEGCELNPSAVKAASLNNVELYLDTVESLAKECPGEYAAVCSFQVLEHLIEPASFLKAAIALLRPGGRLMLGLPNMESFLAHQFNLLDMPPHHMSRWSARILKNIQDRFPLQLVRLAYEPLADYHVQSYVEAYTGLLSHLGLRLAIHPWVRSRLASLIHKSGVQKHLRGQSLYACYVRT
jgi:SAM-dependent methyltransferase